MTQTVDLANIYAQYFVEDFTFDVLRHLGGSYTLPQGDSREFINKIVDDLFEIEDVKMTSSNSICRFLYECADYALEGDYEDPESRETWRDVSTRPSIHHNELQSLVYNSAGLYHKTVSTTLVNVVARDAHTAAKSIAAAAQTRVALEETGGTIHQFNWGILNDGMWLNSAILKAYDLASIFRVGDPVVSYYTTTAFKFAQQYAVTPYFDDEAVMRLHGEVDSLIAQSNPDEINDALSSFSQGDLNDVLFTSGILSRYVDTWERGTNYTAELVGIIDALSGLAKLVSVMLATYSRMGEEDGVSQILASRLNAVNDVVTLVLVGLEAVRETKFSQTLIMNVVATNNDPTVEVYINKDMMNAYHAAGGEDADLVRFGLYLDPRRGTVAPGSGWSLEFVLNRKDDVIPQIMAETSERLESLRSNDAATIEQETLRIVGGLVNSYQEASSATYLKPAISQSVGTLARSIINPDTSVDVEHQIATILLDVIDDPHLQSVFGSLTKYLSSGEPDEQSYAASYAIAETAAKDAILYISAPQE